MKTTEKGNVKSTDTLARVDSLLIYFLQLFKKSFLALTLLGLIQASSVSGQPSSELRTLFFDGVYLENADQILLSSAGRNPNTPASNDITSPAPPALAGGSLLESIRDYEASISNMIENTGSFAPALAQEYMALGTSYQQAGDHESAVQAFENAMYVQRVNEGLFTMAQIEVVRKLIEGYKESRNFSEADRYHEYLYYLMVQNLEDDDEELLAASLEWADWNLEAFRRMAFNQEEELSIRGNVQSGPALMLRRGDLVPVENDQFSEILFVPRAAMLGNASAMPMQSYRAEEIFDPRLKNAGDILETLLESRPNDPEILKRQANITFLFKSQLESLVGENIYGSYLRLNTSRLTRSVSVIRRGYTENRDNLATIAVEKLEENPIDAATAYIDLGDWDLIFDRNQRARQSYNKAREILIAQGYSEQQVSDFITPEPALFVPSFISYEDTRQFQNIPEAMDIPYIGFIDISFNKTRSGSLRNLKVQGVSENTGQRITSRLLALLRTVKARPLFINGDTQAQENINVRYYYSY